MTSRRTGRTAAGIAGRIAAGIGGRHAVAAAIALLLAPAAALGQAGRSAVEEGNRLYDEGRFSEAHEKYLEALREAPDSPVIRFNDGSALYQGQDWAGALDAFGDAVESGDPRLLSDAWYNLGNAFYRAGQLDRSLEAYKQALRANPGDMDAKHNLERVLQQQQQQNQQQDQKQNQNQNQQNQDQPRDQRQQEDQSQNQEGRQPPPQNPEENQSPGEPNPDQEPREGTPPGQMTREEAERLLDAIREKQDEVNRQPRTPARGTRPRKDW
jgi:Ca-activated chloride channel homolog